MEKGVENMLQSPKRPQIKFIFIYQGRCLYANKTNRHCKYLVLLSFKTKKKLQHIVISPSNKRYKNIQIPQNINIQKEALA